MSDNRNLTYFRILDSFGFIQRGMDIFKFFYHLTIYFDFDSLIHFQFYFMYIFSQYLHILIFFNQLIVSSFEFLINLQLSILINCVLNYRTKRTNEVTLPVQAKK